jgi:tRNA(Ile)-lysidine synthase
VLQQVLSYIRERALLRAGDRVAVAVSGGADSVALLRVLLDLRLDLGIVLSVAHFNHGLRGEDSAADEAFVAQLAQEHGLELHVGHGNVRDHALSSKLSIEAAGRELRYRWLTSLAREQRLGAIATAHTLDDQAETVLLKFLRGAGTRGLAGIYPVVDSPSAAGAKAPTSKHGADGAAEAAPFQSQPMQAEARPSGPQRSGPLRNTLPQSSSSSFRIIRPLLCVSRQGVESYLTSLGQTWREDESNLDRRFLRNRVRQDLLPLLEREFNPNVRQVLSDLAEVSRGEEEYWREQVSCELARRTSGVSDSSHSAGDRGARDDHDPDGALMLEGFAQLPMALQRRLLKGFAERQGLTLDFEHVESLRSCALGEHSRAELPGGRIAVNQGAVLALCMPERRIPNAYRYILPIPGQVRVPELGLTLRTLVVRSEFAQEASPGELLSAELIGPELVVRNWCPGDRFWPAHSRSEEKLKRLFAEKRIPAGERPSWLVLLSGEEIVWVRGFPVASEYKWGGKGDAVLIDQVAG